MTDVVNRVVAVELCSPHPQNYNQHDEAQIGDLRASLRRFGQVRSIVVQDDGAGGYLLVAGHGLHQAARAEGFDELRADVIPADWQPARVLAYLAADNELARQGTPDDEQLAALVKRVQEEADEELARLAAGTEERLRELMAGLAQGEPADDPGAQVDRAAELQEKWRTATGQLWIIPSKTAGGEHRVICGDCTDAAVVERVMGGERQSLLTDPPYGIDAANMQMGIGKREFPREGEWDTQRIDILPFVESAESAIVWGGNYYADILPVTPDWLCWHKKNDNLSYAEFELAWSNVGKRARILAHHWSGEVKLHITQKPLPVMEWCAEFLPANVSVLDPFLGSGTTLVACERLGRLGRGVEIAPEYVAVTLERLAGMGLEPRLAES